MYRTLTVVASLALLAAFGPWPYGYFQLLRLAVCGVAAYGAYLAFRSQDGTWGWGLTFIAVLFNPLAPIYFDRSTWLVLDVGAAVALLISGVRVEERAD